MNLSNVLLEVLATPRAQFAVSSREKTRDMPGDELVPHPVLNITHAISIDAPAERIWPWLAQLGAGRGGWYSYDWLDNGGRPSAKRVLERFQRIAAGDVLPALPGATEAFVVAKVEPPRDLVLIVRGQDGPVISWEHLIVPAGEDRSRLVVRARVAKGWQEGARWRPGAGPTAMLIESLYTLLGHLPDGAMAVVAGSGHRLLEARHLRGIKRRAEALTH